MDIGNASDNKGSRQSRARRTCSACHIRKTKCDVQLQGPPCSNCIHLAEVCVVRRRKNARLQVKSPLTSNTTAKARVDGSLASPTGIVLDSQQPEPSTQIQTISSPELVLQGQVEFAEGDPSTVDSSPYFDVTTLADFEDIFLSAFDTHVEFQRGDGHQQVPKLQHTAEQNPHHTGFIPVTLPNLVTLGPGHYELLQSQMCLSLPPKGVLHHLMKFYFCYVHPNLPIVDENEVWTMFSGPEFAMGNFSYLLLRAMIFASIHFLSHDTLQFELGYTNKREARLAYYNQAKLLYTLEVEREPLAIARACLLLTYYAPNSNTLRINSCWLSNAAHYANIAQAGAFPFLKHSDPERARVLKRLWWCLLFRDRSLSLGLRRPMMVPKSIHVSEAQHSLQVEDFLPELGKSEVHDRATQLRLIDVCTAMCRLVQCLTPALELLYRYERVDQRIAHAKLQSPFPDLQLALEGLQAWHEQASQTFPAPLTLDLDERSSGAVSIFGNTLFVLYDSAIFALHQHWIMVNETTSVLDAQLLNQHNPVLLMENVVTDISNRMVEVLQARLARYLPMAISAFLALPLILQAINVKAACNRQPMESIESRKLEVLARILENQVLNFDGSDFIGDILTNIYDYTKKLRLLDEGRSQADANVSQYSGHYGSTKVAPQWPELLRKKPRLLLRLLLRLDRTLCTGGINGDDDCPFE